MSAVWVVRDATLIRQAVFLYEHPAQYMADLNNGFTVTRETLLTPAQAAVIDAAKAYEAAHNEILSSPCWTMSMMTAKADALIALRTAVTTLRAQEGES